MGIVKDLGELDTYLFTGHSVIMGNQQAEWQDDTTILGMFAKTKTTARRKYREFVEKGIDAGRRPELVGGGLIRSVGGWKMAKMLLKGQDRSVVQARSVLCFPAVRELGITATDLAGQMGLTQPAISISVKRGAGIVKEEKLSIDDFIT